MDSYQRDAQRSIINQWPLVDKIRFLRTKTNHASLPEIKLALEQCNGNVFHVIEQFDSLRTHLERVAEENARLFAKADGKQLQDEPLLIADVIAQLTSLNLRYKFPTPAEMQNSAKLTKEERYNYFHLLGTEFEQSVPW